MGVFLDWFEEREIFDWELENGSVSPTAFVIHRFIYETFIFTIEASVWFGVQYWILNGNSVLCNWITCMTIAVVVYNCVLSSILLVCKPNI